MTRPNLVYIFADQLRYQSLGYAGDAKALTPNIDRLASTSVNFVNAIAGSPVCTAYRAALMTGKHTTSNGMVINELRINPNQRCFGHVLTDAGYATSYIGKWHLYANELGHHDDAKNSFVPRGPHRLGFDGEWKAYNFHHENYGTFYHTESEEKIYYGAGVYEPEAQFDLAIDFVERSTRFDSLPFREGVGVGAPFALFLSLGVPHDPWGQDNVPVRFFQAHELTRFPNPPNYVDHNDAPYADAWARLSDHDRQQLEDWRRVYYAQTTSLDSSLGRFLSALDESGAADNTILVFTSDHGEMFGAHGRRAKNIFYEEACRIPMLMRVPETFLPFPLGRGLGGRFLSRTVDACLSTVDIMPTLLSLLGLDIPDGVEGMDLSHFALGQSGPEPDAAFMQICGATADWQDGHEWRALRDKRYTYAIYHVDSRELLFDHVDDPYQLNDLAANPEHAETIARFRVQLAARMAAINDTFETCAWYRDHWTDGNRNIIRSATSGFTG